MYKPDPWILLKTVVWHISTVTKHFIHVGDYSYHHLQIINTSLHDCLGKRINLKKELFVFYVCSVVVSGQIFASMIMIRSSIPAQTAFVKVDVCGVCVCVFCESCTEGVTCKI